MTVNGSSAPLEWARDYKARGWCPIPVPHGQKAPTLPEWPKLRLDTAAICQHFDRRELNIGVLLGEPSGRLVDVDLDCPETMLLAQEFLPPTASCFGRQSKPQSHWLYQVDRERRTSRYQDVNGEMLVELRSTGTQTIFPGSTHPSGEAIEWDSDGAPATIAGNHLERFVTHLAAAALLARHWPALGTRHEVSLAAAGLLVRLRLSEVDARKIVRAAARAAGDEESADRERDVVSTANAFGTKPTTGGPRLAELLRGEGRTVVATLRRWLTGTSGEGDVRLPAIDATDQDLPRVTEAAWQALLEANEPPVLFRMGALVRLEEDDLGAPLVRVLTADRLRYRLARVARWYRSNRSATRSIRVATEPPSHVVRDMLACPDPPLPVLDQIVAAPILTREGVLLATAGYDRVSRLFYAPGSALAIPRVPEEPAAGDIAQARALLLEDLLGDFPFAGPSERAHAVALLLLPFLRLAIDGATPLHLIEKPSPGTGASLLADALIFPALGRPVAAMTEGRDEDEWRKRIMAKLTSGAQVLLLDNLRRRLDSAAVAAAITAAVWEDRRLGQSEIIRVPVRCVWIATGNNPALSAEMARRTVRIRLDARIDRPWLREGFRHPNLRQWIREHRPDLAWAALVLARAWVVAGQPDGHPTLGMFEDWSRVMGGVLAVAGIPGFLRNLPDFYETADDEGADLRAFLQLWWQAHGPRPLGVSELFAVATSPNSPLEVDGKSEQGRKVKLGKLIATMRDRVFQLDGGLSIRLEQAGKHRKAVRWRLAPVAAGECGESGESDPSTLSRGLEILGFGESGQRLSTPPPHTLRNERVMGGRTRITARLAETHRMTGPVPVPTLDQLADNSDRAQGLPPEILVALALRCITAQGALTFGLAQALTTRVRPQDNTPPTDDRLLTPRETSVILNVSVRWLYRHASRLPFTRRLSRKRLRFSETGLRRYLETRRG